MNVPLWLFISCVVLAGLVGWAMRGRTDSAEWNSLGQTIARLTEEGKQRQAEWEELRERRKSLYDAADYWKAGFKEPIRHIEQRMKESE